MARFENFEKYDIICSFIESKGNAINNNAPELYR